LQSGTEKLPIKEKIGYALGDTAANFIFQTMIMFQLVFYTDTFGISAIFTNLKFVDEDDFLLLSF
jgi:glycoside/pentoside/hexuronide:cation symporter, GPH family